MTRSESSELAVGGLRDTGWLSVGAVVLIVSMLVSVAGEITGQVGARVVTFENWTEVVNAFLVALLVSSPTLVIVGVLADFAGLFRRTEEGEVFTDRNLRTLRSAGGGILWAAAASAIIVPTVLSWVTGDGRGILWEVNDLALGTGAMGLAILGLGRVFAEGVRLKDDSDQII